jgi:sugar O-acyltransferase (sialic acid O-acetyltransferase NeuD family)
MVAQNIVIISAGKFGREVHSWVGHAREAGQPWRIKGFLDSRAGVLNGFNRPTPILASVEDYSPAPGDLFLCAIGDPETKRKYAEIILQKGGQFATLIHPTAVIGENVTLGAGVMLAPFATVTADVRLGSHVYIGPGTTCSHDNVIGNWSQLSGNCCLGGNVTVGEGCFFGLSATVMPGVRIGRRAFIGVGSVVLRDVPDGVKVFGNPARQIGKIDV